MEVGSSALDGSSLDGLDTVENAPLIMLSNNVEIPVQRRACKHSQLLNSHLAIDYNSKSITINQVEPEILKLVAEYLNHYTDQEIKMIKGPLPSAELKDVTNEWEVKFTDGMEKEACIAELLQLMLAANFMDIPTLRALTCAKFATLLKSMTYEQLKKLLGMGDLPDLTPKEEEETRKKHPEYFAWLEPPESVEEKK